VGAELQVNTYTTGSQLEPAVAADGAGNFVVVWRSVGSAGADTDYESIQGQRYDDSGTPLGTQFEVNTYTTSHQLEPAVAADGGGNFVVVWTSYGGGTDTSAGSIQAQRYNAAGVAVGLQFQVNTYATGSQDHADVATDAAGKFVVAWRSVGSASTDTSGQSIQAQRFNAAGATVGGECSDPGRGTHAQRLAVGRPILAKKILVKNPTGSESQRTVVALGKETTTDIGPAIVGNPTIVGATLRVVTRGATDSGQTYVLDSSGWKALAVGYRYAGPTGGDGDPVKKVLLKRTPAGVALVKAILKGSLGTQSLDVTPPDPGDEGGIILAIPGGGAYCATFGGSAGGTEVRDDAQVWKITNPTAQGCPLP